MSMSRTLDRPQSPAIAYPASQRRAHAEQHLLICADRGWLSQTSCTEIVKTYGCQSLLQELKQLKRSLFPEFLSNLEGGK